MKEKIEIEGMERSCYVCEDYSKEHSANPPKVAILSCEGACARGEVSRLAANYITNKLSPDHTVRICLGAAFTKDTGQRGLVRNASKAIIIEGCFIHCASRMMKGVLPELEPIVIDAGTLYDSDLPFEIHKVSDQELKDFADIVAEKVVKDYVQGDHKSTPDNSPCSNKSSACSSTPSSECGSTIVKPNSSCCDK